MRGFQEFKGQNVRLVYDREHADFVVKIEPHLFVVREPGPKSRRSASTAIPGKPRGGANGERGFRRRSLIEQPRHPCFRAPGYGPIFAVYQRGSKPLVSGTVPRTDQI